MRLSWDYGYKDYADREHFLPRLKELVEYVSDTPPEIACGLNDESLLNFMEDNEELMRYYIVEHDFGNLEPCMRLHDALIQECESRGIASIGFQYLKMEFIRANALLYRSTGQNRKAVEYFNEFCDLAKTCFDRLKTADSLTDEQILFVGWACTEGMNETVQAYDAMALGADSTAHLYSIIRMLDWLEPYMEDYVGIRDKSANLYCSIAGMLYQLGDPRNGKLCFENSIRIYNGLDDDFDSDFYRALAIWARGLYGLQEFTVQGNPQTMMACKAEAEEYLAARSPNSRDRGIILGAEGLVVIQQSISAQLNGNISGAIELCNTGCGHLKRALSLLEDEIDSIQGYGRNVLTSIAARVFSIYAGALDMAGVQYFNGENYARAKECFHEALHLIADSSRYTGGESGVVIMRAESSMYLAMIAFEEGNFDEAVFYGEQAAEQSGIASKQSRAPGIWGMYVSSCALMSDVYLALKNKPQAKSYAAKGLELCDQLQKIAPDAPQLQFRTDLEKNLRKASRRFF